MLHDRLEIELKRKPKIDTQRSGFNLVSLEQHESVAIFQIRKGSDGCARFDEATGVCRRW
jgi:hypothetical protein